MEFPLSKKVLYGWLTAEINILRYSQECVARCVANLKKCNILNFSFVNIVYNFNLIKFCK